MANSAAAPSPGFSLAYRASVRPSRSGSVPALSMVCSSAGSSSSTSWLVTHERSLPSCSAARVLAPRSVVSAHAATSCSTLRARSITSKSSRARFSLSRWLMNASRLEARSSRSTKSSASKPTWTAPWKRRSPFTRTSGAAPTRSSWSGHSARYAARVTATQAAGCACRSSSPKRVLSSSVPKLRRGLRGGGGDLVQPPPSSWPTCSPAARRGGADPLGGRTGVHGPVGVRGRQ